MSANQEAYDHARGKLMGLIDNPDKSIPVPDYKAQLDAASSAVKAAYEVLIAEIRNDER
jgi:hypothetical protein